MAFYDQDQDRFNIVISFNETPNRDFGVFAKGYHSAANTLCQEFLKKPGFRDYDGYPIVFLYRHSFELYLKGIINWAALMCSFKDIQSLDTKLMHIHVLEKLANQVMNLMNALYPSDQDLGLLMNELLLTAQQFDELDPKSYSFRYPIDKEGNYSTKKHQTVSMSSIYLHMDKLLTKLQAINFGLKVEIDGLEETYHILSKFIKYK